MKEKINQLARGIFEYEMPMIVSEPRDLQFSIDAGEVYKGSFLLSNDRGRVMKGMIYTDCHHLVFEEAAFQGVENEIDFTISGTYFVPGEVIRGNIRVVSDCGSVLLPFSVTACVPSCVASTGQIRDLSHFADLARESMPEAVKLFSDPHFEAVFLEKDARKKALYRGLSKGTDKGLALEEFLIAIHKKVPIHLSVEKHSLYYKSCQEAFQDKIIVQKDTWGYCEYEVAVDAHFIGLEHNRIRSVDFVGDIYELGFVVHPEKMTGGRNYARLTISNIHQVIEVDIIADQAECDRDWIKQRFLEQQGVFELYRNFLQFRCSKITQKEYCLAVERVVCKMDKLSEEEGKYDWMKKMFWIHLGILNNLEETVMMELNRLEEKKERLFQDNPLLYCAYFYLLAQFNLSEDIRADAASKVRECYLSREDHWLVLWFLLELDGENMTVRRQQEFVLEQLKKGCQSPLLYLKLCEIYQKQPELLLELDGEKERCLHWGCCQGILSQELQFRYTYLIGRQKNFSSLLLKDLCLIYKQTPTDDILAIICQMLMKDRKVSQDGLKWFALGIEKNLKITDLYEYYMYALEESPDMVIPQKVLLYFTYINHLNITKKALLFAYVIRHRAQDKKTYDAYVQAIRQFAMEQIMEGRISANLAVIYEQFLGEEAPNETLAKKLPAVLFAREITCYNSDIIGVAVAHQEMDQEEFVPLVHGRAVITVYTGNAQIFLLDTKGNRYTASIEYTSSQLLHLHLDYLAQKCFQYAGDDTKLLLHLYEKAESLNQTGDEVMEMRRRVMDIPQLEAEYRKKVFAALVRCYFDRFEGEMLDYQLQHMDWQQVAAEDRGRFVEYCAIRHCFEKGMEGIMAFGYGRMEAGRLLQISADTFRRSLEKEDVRLVKLAWFIFQNGQYDEALIYYLCDYFTGSVEEMVQIWKAADSFEMDTSVLVERILAQMLFTEEMVPEGYDIFYRYYDQGLNKKLIRAFLKLTAYRYLIKDWDIPEEMFGYFYKDVKVEENLPCLLASLHHMSRKERLDGKEAAFVDYNIHQLCERGIMLGFYSDFQGKVSLPDRLSREQCIEYKTDPGSTVKIQYRIISGGVKGEFITEAMPNVFEGIRVKTVVLFQDEMMEYRILETGRNGQDRKTQFVRLACQERAPGSGSWYHMLNRMMSARDSQDKAALIDIMREYAEKRETVKQLMRPLK